MKVDVIQVECVCGWYERLQLFGSVIHHLQLEDFKLRHFDTFRLVCFLYENFLTHCYTEFMMSCEIPHDSRILSVQRALTWMTFQTALQVIIYKFLSTMYWDTDKRSDFWKIVRILGCYIMSGCMGL